MLKIKKVVSMVCILSLILSIISIGSVYATAVTSVTTGSGLALSDNGTVDISEQSLKVNLDSAIDESTLASGVTLENVTYGDVLNIHNEGVTNWNPAGANFYLNQDTPSAGVTAGIYTVEFNFQVVGGNNNAYYWLRLFDNASTPAQAARIDFKVGSPITYFYGNGSSQGPSFTANDWHNIKIEINTAGTYSVRYDNNATLMANNVPLMTTHLSGNPLKLIRFTSYYQSANTPVDINFSTFKFSKDGAAVFEIPKFDSAKLAQYFEVINQNVSGNVSIKNIVTASTAIACTRAYDSVTNVYTLTPSNKFEQGAKYRLNIGTTVTNPQVIRFNCENINPNNLLINSITAGGSAISNNSIVPIRDDTLAMNFSTGVDESTLASNVTLEKETYGNVINIHNGGGSAWKNAKLNYYLNSTSPASGVTTGTYTIDYKFQVVGGNSTKVYYWMVLYDTAGKEAGRIDFKPGAKIKYFYKGGNSDTNVTFTANDWHTVSLTINPGTETYSATFDGTSIITNTLFETTHTSGTAMRDILLTSYYEDITPAIDINISNFKALQNGTAIFEITDFDETKINTYFTKTFPVGGIGTISAKNILLKTETVNGNRVYNSGEYKYTITPTNTFTYMDKYKLTIGSGVQGTSSNVLLNPQVVNFTTVYSDSMYVEKSGFTNDASETLGNISNTFYGNINGWADIHNYSSTSKTAEVIVAIYKEGKLFNITTNTVSVGAGLTVKGTASAGIFQQEVGSGYTSKVFVWDNINDMFPICPENSI